MVYQKRLQLQPNFTGNLDIFERFFHHINFKQ
jgi:hypothetical protein